MDAEAAHISSIKLLSSFPLVLSEVFGGQKLPKNDRYKLTVGGQDWSFPIGLAAGLDKNAEAIDFFSSLYF